MNFSSHGLVNGLSLRGDAPRQLHGNLQALAVAFHLTAALSLPRYVFAFALHLNSL